MPPEVAINPYQPPEQVSLPEDVSNELAPLKDPRLFAWTEYLSWIAFSLAVVVALFQPHDGSWSELLSQVIRWSLIGIALSHALWIYRCAKNADIIDSDAAPGPLWAVICHIVPVAQFFMPCMVVRQIARATFKYKPAKGLDTFILVWWVMFFGLCLLTGSNETLVLNLLWRLLTLLVAAATIYMMHRITRAQVSFRWTDAPESERPAIPAPPALIEEPALPTPGYPPMRRNIPPEFQAPKLSAPLVRPASRPAVPSDQEPS